MIKTSRKVVCIDVDLDDGGWEATYSMLKALYQYSFIKRTVAITRNGIHVYLNLPFPDSYEKLRVVRAMFGDDPIRLEYDDRYLTIGYYVNKCFTSTEVHSYELR